MTKIVAVKSFDGTEVESVTKDQCHFFDYESMDDSETEHVESDYDKLSFALKELLYWISRGNIHSKEYKNNVFRKMIAICWVVRPEVFNGMSLNKLCKTQGINLRKQSVSKQAQNFTNKFGIKGRAQK